MKEVGLRNYNNCFYLLINSRYKSAASDRGATSKTEANRGAVAAEKKKTNMHMFSYEIHFVMSLDSSKA